MLWSFQREKGGRRHHAKRDWTGWRAIAIHFFALYIITEMPMFLYHFGFESPRQLHNNELNNWDDEDSQAFLIEADNGAAAQEWGQEISERFFKALFGNDAISWRARNYANWIEQGPAVPWPDLQRVHLGECPDFAPWLRRYEKEV